MDLESNLLLADDSELNPFQGFIKANKLLSGVILTKCMNIGGEPDLFPWYIENEHCGKVNRCPTSIIQIINNETNRNGFDFR